MKATPPANSDLPDRTSRGRSYAVLRHRDYRILWSAEFVSTIGTQMQRVAIAWQVYELTGDALSLGILGLVRFGPVVLFGLFGGVLADQRDRRKLLILSQVLLFVCSFGLAAAAMAEVASLAVIYVLTFLAAAVSSFAGPSRQALIPALVPRTELAGAMSLNVLAMQIATVSGPALGGWIIAWRGVDAVYLLDAISFLVVIGGVLMLRTRPPAAGATVGTLAAALQGFRFLRESPMLLGVMAVDFVATFFGASMVLMPVFADEVLDVGASGVGLLYAAPAAGAVIGSMLMSLAPLPRRPGAGVLAAIAVYGAAIAGFGLSTAFFLSLTLLAVSGAADAMSMALRHTIRNLLTPDELRGRVAATHSMFSMGGPQLGEFEAGLVAAAVGAGPSVAIGGIGTVLSCWLIAAVVPAIRRYRL
ncbi:MAG: MFS transporter [Thermomicrobiales bacterium]